MFSHIPRVLVEEVEQEKQDEEENEENVENDPQRTM